MINQPKHTGGNWQVERAESAEYFEFFVRRDGDSRAIASDILDPETGQPSKANARIIAAAPDLLDALKAIMDFCGPSDPNCPDGPDCETCRMANAARAAIAKAEGRGE